MLNSIKIIFISSLSIIIFTGCTTKVVEGDNLIVNTQTIKIPKENVNFDVQNVKLGGDTPKYWDGLPLDENEIKKYIILINFITTYAKRILDIINQFYITKAFFYGKPFRKSRYYRYKY